MKKSKKFVAATMTVTSMAVAMPTSASATEYIPYMLGDVSGECIVNSSDAARIMTALNEHGFERGNRVNVTYVQNHLSDWFPNAACAKGEYTYRTISGFN